MSDLVKRARHNVLADMPHYASVELIEALANRIEELEANRLANKIAIRRLEAELRKFTETGKTQTNPADRGAGLSNSVNDTAP